MGRPRLPSPSTVIALIALVAALAGTAVALPGKGSVKRGDIAKNAVTGKNVKNATLTGKDIRERTLAKVRAAAQADSAERAGAVDSIKQFGPFTLNVGQEEVLLTHGPLSAVAKCAEEMSQSELNTAVETELNVIAVTTEPGSAFAGDDERGIFDAGTPEPGRTFEDPSANDAPGGAGDVSDGYDDDFVLAAPSGSIVQGTVNGLANGDTRSCVVFGSYTIVK